jgi:hypothetical protein
MGTPLSRSENKSPIVPPIIPIGGTAASPAVEYRRWWISVEQYQPGDIPTEKTEIN